METASDILFPAVGGNPSPTVACSGLLKCGGPTVDLRGTNYKVSRTIRHLVSTCSSSGQPARAESMARIRSAMTTTAMASEQPRSLPLRSGNSVARNVSAPGRQIRPGAGYYPMVTVWRVNPWAVVGCRPRPPTRCHSPAVRACAGAWTARRFCNHVRCPSWPARPALPRHRAACRAGRGNSKSAGADLPARPRRSR